MSVHKRTPRRLCSSTRAQGLGEQPGAPVPKRLRLARFGLSGRPSAARLRSSLNASMSAYGIPVSGSLQGPAAVDQVLHVIQDSGASLVCAMHTYPWACPPSYMLLTEHLCSARGRHTCRTSPLDLVYPIAWASHVVHAAVHPHVVMPHHRHLPKHLDMFWLAPSKQRRGDQ